MQELFSAITANETELIWNVQVLSREIKTDDKLTIEDRTAIHNILTGFLTIQFEQNQKLKEVMFLIEKKGAKQ